MVLGTHDFDWIESNKGNPIKLDVLKRVRYREFVTAFLIGFSLLDSIQSNHVSSEPLVPRAPGLADKEREALGTRIVSNHSCLQGLPLLVGWAWGQEWFQTNQVSFQIKVY